MLTISANTDADTVAQRVLALTTVDYVHVLLASAALDEPGSLAKASDTDAEGSTALAAISAAAGAVTSDGFERAIELWRAVTRLGAAESREGYAAIASAASLPTRSLVFRAIGKRGGKGHDFTSDDAKRAAKRGLSSAVGLDGSTAAHHLDVLAQVHRNRFWLGLRLNRHPLAPLHDAPPAATRDAEAQGMTADPEAAAATAAVAVNAAASAPAPTSAEAATARPPPSGSGCCTGSTTVARGAAPSAAAARDESSAPPLLSGFMTSRMAELGLAGPRDARDAVTPLWEMALEEQWRAKQAEMAHLVAQLGGELTACEPLRHWACCEAVGEAAGEVAGEEAGEAARTEPRASRVPLRDVCDFHVGCDRSGAPCCGFRLGVLASHDGVAVAAPDPVPIVPRWMVAVAHELTGYMREAGRGAGGTGECGCGTGSDTGGVACDARARRLEGDPLPLVACKLRGSSRTREAMAMLTTSAAAFASRSRRGGDAGAGWGGGGGGGGDGESAAACGVEGGVEVGGGHGSGDASDSSGTCGLPPPPAPSKDSRAPSPSVPIEARPDACERIGASSERAAGHPAAGQDGSDGEACLVRRLVDAASRHGMRLTAVLVRDADEPHRPPRDLLADGAAVCTPHSADGHSGSHSRAEEPSAGPALSAPELHALGSIHEVLESGLRLRISPTAFFQASVGAAETLFATIVEFACGGQPPPRCVETPRVAVGGPTALSAPTSPTAGTADRPPQSRPTAASAPRSFPPLLLDLCCGGGAIGLEVARAARAHGARTRVVGIELHEGACHDARFNAALNELVPPEYIAVHGKVEDALGEALASLSTADGRDAISADARCGGSGAGGASRSDGGGGGRSAGGAGAVAVLDPPRTGVDPRVSKALRAAEAIERVVFVSCNPHGHTLRHDFVIKGGSLASNVRILCGARGRGAPFRVARAVPIDLFPHTPHVELVLLLERTSPTGGQGAAGRMPRKAR